MPKSFNAKTQGRKGAELMNDEKPDKSVEVPPYDKRYSVSGSLFALPGGCIFGHHFEWRTTQQGGYRQQVCVNRYWLTGRECGITGATQKINQCAAALLQP